MANNGDGGRSEVVQGSAQRTRVLLVDDSAEMRHIYARYLQRGVGEYEISEAGNVAQALAMLSARSYDCVVLDYHLPGESGLELLQRLVDERGRCPLPVVMITGQGNEAVAVRAMKLGARDYLVKNRITARGLVAAIQYAVEKERCESAEDQHQLDLERLSVTDELTGLRNRRYLSGFLGNEIVRAARYGSPLTVMMIDLDYFKQVNDNYGHRTGDRVLREFSRMLTGVVRATDVVTRYGGEEFCVVLCETDLDGAEHLAGRIAAQARGLRHGDGRGGCFYVTCSIGVTEYAAGVADADELIQRGDEALYRAKYAGRNRHCVYSDRQAHRAGTRLTRSGACQA